MKSERLAGMLLIEGAEAITTLREALKEAKAIIVEVLGDDYEADTCPAPDDLCGDRYCRAIGCIADKMRRIELALASTGEPSDATGR